MAVGGMWAMAMRPLTMIVRGAELIFGIIRCVDVVECERSLDRGVHHAERIVACCSRSPRTVGGARRARVAAGTAYPCGSRMCKRLDLGPPGFERPC